MLSFLIMFVKFEGCKVVSFEYVVESFKLRCGDVSGCILFYKIKCEGMFLLSGFNIFFSGFVRLSFFKSFLRLIFIVII